MPGDDEKPIPCPNDPAAFTDPQLWFVHLNHDFCTQWTLDENLEPWQRCRSQHCVQCGLTTGGQGHVNADGTCPYVIRWNEQHPEDPV